MVKPIINHPEIEVYEIGFTTWFPYHLQLPAFALVPPAALGSLGPGTARSGGSREPVRLPAFLGATDRVPALIGNRGGLSGGVFINQTMLKKQIPFYVYNCIHTCAHVFVYIYVCVRVHLDLWFHFLQILCVGRCWHKTDGLWCLHGIYRSKFKRQTSNNMGRWKSRGGKSQRRERKKKEGQRRERVRRKKIQVREKVEKRETLHFSSG